MKKMMVLFVAGVAAVLAAEGLRKPVEPVKPVEPEVSEVDKAEQEVATFIQTLPQRRQALTQKTYTGTLEDVLSASAADTEAILVEAEEANAKAQVVIAAKLSQAGAAKIRPLVKEATDVTPEKTAHGPAVFLLAVAELVKDEATMPDAGTPEYIEEAMRRSEFLKVCVDLVQGKLDDANEE